MTMCANSMVRRLSVVVLAGRRGRVNRHGMSDWFRYRLQGSLLHSGARVMMECGKQRWGEKQKEKRFIIKLAPRREHRSVVR